MELNEIIDEIERQGKAQNVKIYKRYGFGDIVFRVSFAKLKVKSLV